MISGCKYCGHSPYAVDCCIAQYKDYQQINDFRINMLEEQRAIMVDVLEDLCDDPDSKIYLSRARKIIDFANMIGWNRKEFEGSELDHDMAI